MTIELKLTNRIDYTNYQFTSTVRNQLKDLNKFTDCALEWLMMEHYQFSARNTEFLATAVNTTKQFKEKDVSEELLRNFNEERNHAAIYKKSLLEIGTNVDKRVEFFPTNEFFDTISKLIISCPSTTLGAMYATETAAIFEHEVFLGISYEIVKRREKNWVNSRLKAFHDMHLNGVEQGHKDGLGMFVDLAKEYDFYANEKNEEQLIDKKNVIIGANQAINAMVVWWKALLKQAENMG